MEPTRGDLHEDGPAAEPAAPGPPRGLMAAALVLAVATAALVGLLPGAGPPRPLPAPPALGRRTLDHQGQPVAALPGDGHVAITR